ncbi:MAG: sigma-70 family RNA polymerase sigma factor [Desulfitobacterium sp.]|nr:sigma-70 family RNA polymerase sigma factor [Desulfitobacterium sp.]
MGIFNKVGKKGCDQNSYLAFIAEYKKSMYRIAYGYLGNPSKALDAVDQAIYLGYLHLQDLREPRYLKTWLTLILINECYRILKETKREIPMEELPEGKIENLDSSEYSSLPIKLAVQALPEELRKVIVLRYFGGYTIAETADLLDIPEGTVSTRSRKALQLLRVELEDD